jgi:hypothetical protein
MARRVFFSFHYERDAGRAGVVRNHSITKDNFVTAGYIDAAAWESIKRQGDYAIKRWIDGQLQNTTVTVVLIGAETATRSWVKYEIERSRKKGNGLLGIRIHNIKDFRTLQTDYPGQDPFVGLGYTGVKVYDWVNDLGYTNFSTWIEAAAVQIWR